MALRTAPTPIARPELNLTGTAGPGMTVAARHDAVSMELAVHCAEALTFVERARVHARSLEWASREIGPGMHQHALALLALIESYGRRHEPLDDEPAEVAA